MIELGEGCVAGVRGETEEVRKSLVDFLPGFA